MSTPAFVPTPCEGCGGGGGAAGFDAEGAVLCDFDANGNQVGTALVEGIYDQTSGIRTGTRIVDPVTGDPYVPTGTLRPCDTGDCGGPQQFCFTTTTTGPVEHPGRQYDITLPINPGFAVDSLQIDATNYPANVLWSVLDADGSQFAGALQTFLEGRFPGRTVTVTNPNAGTPVCGLAAPMTVHIECTRVDEPAPDLVELIYNGGRDLVVNPAYLTTPPTNLNGPQFVYLRRQDAGGTLNCTNTPNRGWETNDLGDGNRDFELWGQGPGGLQTLEAATPTPRGTPIQEITADINDTGTGPTIWQTFTVPAAGTLKAVLVHGARDNGEQHRITLSTGDTNDNQVGDIINNITNPPQVTNAGGGSPGPWTTFQQDVALGVGTYTFAISTTNPVGANRGGLFTDMRVYVDSPAQHATAVNDDGTCTVTVDETTTLTDCQWWDPSCGNLGNIESWKNVETGQILSNAAFWAQVPSPECCTPEAASGGGGSVNANLVQDYPVCAVVGGVPTTLQRVVITDGSGGALLEQFIGPNGGPVAAPAAWTIGPCGGDCTPLVLGNGCYIDAGDNYRRFVHVRDCDGVSAYYDDATGIDITQYVLSNGVATCIDTTYFHELLCDSTGEQFVRIWSTTDNGSIDSENAKFLDYDLAGEPFNPAGAVEQCGCGGCGTLVLCDSLPGSPTERITNGDFVTDGAGWVFTGSAARTAFAGEPGPDNVPGVIGFNGANQPANGTATTTINTGIVAGDVFSLTYRVGSFSSSSASQGPVSVLTEVLDGSDNVLASQVITPSLSAGTGVATWPPNGFGSLPGIVATDGIIKVRFTDQSTGNLVDADMMVDKVSLIQQQLTGETVQFLRTICRECDGTVTATIDTTLAGAPYAVQGVVALCEPTTEPVPTPDTRDAEIQILCDSTPTRFLRKYLYDGETGAFTTVVNTTLDGTTPFAPVGAVGICTTPVATDFDFAIEQLCDNNGAFLRRFTFNSATGAVTTITNTNLAGAAYVPVGTVGTCENCCPVVVGEGCTNTGSGRYTAIRAVNGTISLIDSVSGAAVLPANVIACPTDDVVVTSTAEARLLNAGESWTPGTDLTGTLTGLMFQVLTGTADLVDANGTASSDLPAGTSVSWSTEDNNALTGPQSITADAASSVLVTWTRH